MLLPSDVYKESTPPKSRNIKCLYMYIFHALLLNQSMLVIKMEDWSGGPPGVPPGWKVLETGDGCRWEART